MSEYKFIIDKTQPHLGGNIDGGDPATFTPTLWNELLARFKVREVLDVGCGQGHAIAYMAARADVMLAVGIDGLPQNVKETRRKLVRVSRQRPVLRVNAAIADLTRGPWKANTRFDLVWCCEVVEHVEEQYVDHLLDTLTQGLVIAMTHAEPGQPGHHHKNCKESVYWIAHFEKRGYELFAQNQELRDLAIGHFARSGLVFVRKTK